MIHTKATEPDRTEEVNRRQTCSQIITHFNFETWRRIHATYRYLRQEIGRCGTSGESEEFLIRRQESMQSTDSTDFETREVQNTGISGATKRTCFLQIFFIQKERNEEDGKLRLILGWRLRGAFSVTRRLILEVPLGNRKRHMGAPRVNWLTPKSIIHKLWWVSPYSWGHIHFLFVLFCFVFTLFDKSYCLIGSIFFCNHYRNYYRNQGNIFDESSRVSKHKNQNWVHKHMTITTCSTFCCHRWTSIFFWKSQFHYLNSSML